MRKICRLHHLLRFSVAKWKLRESQMQPLDRPPLIVGWPGLFVARCCLTPRQTILRPALTFAVACGAHPAPQYLNLEQNGVKWQEEVAKPTYALSRDVFIQSYHFRAGFLEPLLSRSIFDQHASHNIILRRGGIRHNAITYGKSAKTIAGVGIFITVVGTSATPQTGKWRCDTNQDR